MTKHKKTMTMWGAIVVFTLIVIFSVGIYNGDAMRAKREIKSVQEAIGADIFEEEDIDNLRTEEAKEYAKSAFEEWEKMVNEYPVSEIELLNTHEVVVVDNPEGLYLDDFILSNNGNRMTTGDVILESQSDSGEYLIKFKAVDAEAVFLYVVVIGSKTEVFKTEVFPDDSGVYSYLIPLEDIETKIEITTRNKYKDDSVVALIIRNENAEERQSRLAIEKAQAEWDSSKAGKLCKKYPYWSESDCTKVADNKYWIGMSLDMLKEQRGTPNSANPSDYGYGTSWQWCWTYYTPMCFYGDDYGIIDSYN